MILDSDLLKLFLEKCKAMQLKLTIDLAKILDPAWAVQVESYFRGEKTALEACAVMGCDRRDWDRTIAAIISTVVRNQYDSGNQGTYGSIEVVSLEGNNIEEETEKKPDLNRRDGHTQQAISSNTSLSTTRGDRSK